MVRFIESDQKTRLFFTIADFEEFCREHRIVIHERIALDTEDRRIVAEDANRFADMAIFVISK